MHEIDWQLISRDAVSAKHAASLMQMQYSHQKQRCYVKNRRLHERPTRFI